MTGAMTGLVAFDLDGTLVDSATDLAAAASALTVELGGRPLTRPEVVAMVGEGAPVLVRPGAHRRRSRPRDARRHRALPRALRRADARHDRALSGHAAPCSTRSIRCCRWPW